MDLRGITKRFMRLFTKEGAGRIFAAPLVVFLSCAATAYADLYPGSNSSVAGISTPVDLCPVHLAVSTPALPANGGYARAARPNFAWTGPSTGVAAGLANFQVQVSSNDPNFAATVGDDLVAITVNPALPRADGAYQPSYSLDEATTYYWRVRAISYAGSNGPWSSTSVFHTDFSSPTVSGYVIKSSTGGWLSQSQWLDMTSINSARVTVQDIVTGLNTATGTFSVQYSVNAGASWNVVTSTDYYAYPYLDMQAADGSTSASPLLIYDMTLVQSTNTETCSGSPCGATNQLKFTVSDRAGNSATGGPYAALVDSTSPDAPEVTVTAVGSYQITVEAAAADALSGVKDYNFEISSSPTFAFGVSSSNYTGNDTYTFYDLRDGTVYYIRADARDYAYNYSDLSAVVSTTTPGVVYTDVFDVAPDELLQGATGAFLMIGLRTNPGLSTYLSQVKAAKLGTIPDSGIEAAYIYLDNGNSSFGAGDSLIGSAPVVNGTATINITPQVINATSTIMFAAYKISPYTEVGRTIGARISSGSDLAFNQPFAAEESYLEDSWQANVADGPNVLTVTPSVLAPDITRAGVSNLPVIRLAAQTNTGTSRLDSLLMYLDGTAPVNYINAVKVYRDSNANAYYDAGDALIGSDVFASGIRTSTVSFTGSSVDLRTSSSVPVNYFVTLDIDAGAQQGYDFSVRIATASHLTAGGAQDTVSFTSAPFSAGSAFDSAGPSASAFGTYSSTGGWLGAAQWAKTASGAIARISALDTVSGLSVATGTFSVQYSSNAGASWGTVVSTVVGSAPYLAWTGVQGSTVAQTLTVFNLSLRQSTNTQTCSAAPCGATDQVKFTMADRAGNSSTAGPYSVLTDTTLPTGVTVSPNGIGDYSVSVLASAGDALSGVKDYNHEASVSPDFDSFVSSSDFTGPAYTFAGLYDGATYYLRSTARDNAYNLSAVSAAVSTMTAGIVHFTAQSTAPASLMQGTSAAFLIFDLNTNTNRTTYLQQVRVARTGTVSDADIAAVDIYHDTSGNGTWGAGDTLMGSALVTAGTATVTVTPQYINSTAKRFFAVLKLAPAVTVGKTVGARIESASGLGFQYPFRAVGTFPAETPGTAVTDGPNILAITPSSLASGVAQPGVTDLGVIKLAAQANTGTTRLDKVVLNMGGDAPVNYINMVKVYRDSNSNGVFDGDDALMTAGGDAFSSEERSSTVTFTASEALRTVGTTPVNFFIAVDIAAGAQEGYQFNVRISSASSFTPGNPLDTVSLSSCPFTSNTLLIQTNNTATINLAAIARATMDQGAMYQVAVATLNVSAGVTQLSRVKVNRLGTGTDSDATVSVYQDITLDGGPLNADEDVLLGSAAFSGGVATVGLSTVTVSAGINTVLFYALNVSSLANAGNTIGISVTNADYFTLPAYTLSKTITPLPFNTGTAEIKAVICRLMLTDKADLTTGTILEGATNYPMLKLQFATDKLQAYLTAVRVNKTGTLPDSLVSALKIYRDDSGDGQFGSGDTLVTQGNDLFSAGSSNLSFVSPQAVTAAPRTYFVTAGVSQNIEAGYTFGLTIPSTSYFTVSSPNLASTGTVAYPAAAGPISVQLYPNTVTISTAGIYPSGVYPGGTNVALFKLTARADVTKAKLLSMKFERTGTSSDSDVSKVKVYYDLNSYGYFDPSALTNYSLVTPSTVTFGSDGTVGTAFLNISTAAQTVTTLPANYFLVVDIAPAAEVGRTLAVRALNNTYFSVSAPNTVAPMDAFTTPALTIQAPQQTLYARFESKLSTYVVQGQNTVLVSSFTVYASSYTISLSEVDIMRAGDGYDADIAELRLYRDDGDGVWEGIGTEPLVSSAAFSGGIAAFGMAETVSRTRRTYYIVANVATSAAYGRTFGITVPSINYFKVDAPHVVSPTNFPFSGQLAAIQPTVDVLTITPVDSAPSLKQGDSNKVMGRFTAASDDNSVTLASVRFDKTGTLPDADIVAVRAWLDDGDGVFSSLNDTVVAQAGAFSNGYAVLSFAPAQVVSAAQKIYFVTVSVSSVAASGSTFGMRATTQYFSALAPDSVSVTGGSAVFTMVGTLADDPDTVYMRFSDRATGSLYQGSQNNYMAKLELWTDRDRASVSALRVDLSGNVEPSAVAVKLYKDTDGNGAFSSVYDVLAASAQVSGTSAALSFSGGLNVTASTATFFLMMDIAASASMGGTAGLGFINEANFTMSGADTVAAFSDLSSTVGTIKDSKTPTPPTLYIYKANGEPFGDEAARYNAYRTRVRFAWESSVILGSIEQVYYYVGSAAADGNTPPASWTGGGLNREVWAAGLDLAQGGSYYLCVRTRNSLDGSYSDIVCRQFSVDATVPALGSGALSAISEQNSTLITWDAADFGPSGLDYYKIEERRAGSPLWVLMSTTSLRTIILGSGSASAAPRRAARTAAVIDRAPGTYFYRVTPVNCAGLEGSPTSPVRVDLALGSLNKISSESAYPNPADTRTGRVTIHFQLNSSGPASVKIYDIYGGKVRALDSAADTVHDVVWDGADSSGKKVSKGLYIAVIEAIGDSKKVKIGVIH